MNYHMMYRKVSSKKKIRMVNVKGESIVKGGKCTTEKMSPRPRTITGIRVSISAEPGRCSRVGALLLMVGAIWKS